MTYPSGGNYPETKDDWVEHFFTMLKNATPQQLQGFCRKQREKGGKFKALAQVIEGEITVKQFNQKCDEMEE